MNRDEQIRQELTALEVPVTDEAISTVKDFLKNNGRATVKSACKRLAEAYSQQSKQTNKAGGELNSKLAAVANQMKAGIKNQIVTSAVRGALEDFRNGDFGDISQVTLDELDDAIDVEYSFLELTDLDPKYALPSRDCTSLPSGDRKLLGTGQNQDDNG